MVYIDHERQEIRAKIVYCGPGMSGKTTNLEQIHKLMRPQMRSELMSVATEKDRTIFFDYLPVNLGTIGGFNFKVRTFTVPGQPYYKETRKAVLKGADGAVFVADSQQYMMDQNLDSLYDFKQNLRENGLNYETIPLIMQYNKRDLSHISPVHLLNERLNPRQIRYFESVATQGSGVVETLRAITLSVFNTLELQPHSDQSRHPEKPRQQTSSVRDLPKRTPTRPHSTMSSTSKSNASITHTGSLPQTSMATLHHQLQAKVDRLESELLSLKDAHENLKRVVGRHLLPSGNTSEAYLEDGI